MQAGALDTQAAPLDAADVALSEDGFHGSAKVGKVGVSGSGAAQAASR